jgi:two-component system copper resistance phosphate regulon response regulator CusR
MDRFSLTETEYRLLALLLAHTGTVLSRSFIAAELWDRDVHCNSNVVDVHMRRLRSKVDARFVKKLIHTVRGTGYVLEERAQGCPA